MDVNWKTLEDLYDEAERRRPHRRLASSSRSVSSSPREQSDYPIEVEPDHPDYEKQQAHIAYCLRMLDDPILNEVMYDICRLNLECSDAHAAHIFMRLYGNKVSPFKVPFKPVGYVVNRVWNACVDKMTMHHAVATEWVLSEREELIVRYTNDHEHDNTDDEIDSLATIRPLSSKKRKALLDAWCEADEGFETRDATILVDANDCDTTQLDVIEL